MRLINKRIWLILIAVVFSESTPKDMLNESFDFLTKHYVDSIDQVQIVRSAINGMVEELDPYTKLVIGSSKDNLDMLTRGEYGGVGIRIGSLRDTLTVLSTMKDGPAYKSSLKAGDQIIGIDETDAIGKTTKEASKLIKGKLGTVVTLHIRRLGFEEIQIFNLKRASINVNNIGYKQIDENSIGYIKINKFSRNISKDFIKSLKELDQELFIDNNNNRKWDSEESYRDSNDNEEYDLGERYVDKNKNGLRDDGEVFFDINGNNQYDKFGRLKGLIIDLRGNTGGLLSESIKILNTLLNRGEVLLHTKGRNGKVLKEFKSQTRPVLSNEVPIVVLVDKRSASASEIVSGVIQDLDRGIVIGNTTFGKGLVQKIRHLNDTTSLKVTYSKYYIPSGRLIQKQDWLDNGVLTDGEDMKDSAFYTIKNNREVRGGGGVSPDIIVDLDKMSPYVNALWKENLFLSFATKYLSNQNNMDTFISRLTKALNKYVPSTEKVLDCIFTPALIDKYPLGIDGLMINEIEIIDAKILKSFKNHIDDSDYSITYKLAGEEELASFKKEIVDLDDSNYNLFLNLFTGSNPDKMVKKIENYYNKKKKNQFINKKNKSFLISGLEREFARFLFNEEVRVGVSLRNDKTYFEGIAILKDKELYNSILGY